MAASCPHQFRKPSSGQSFAARAKSDRAASASPSTALALAREAQFYIGLRRLGEGNRQTAKACFQRSLDTGVALFSESIWSRTFLAHIDDPDWLPWIR